MGLTRVSAPFLRRIYDRLLYWQKTGPYLSGVRQIRLGPIGPGLPVALNGPFVALVVSCGPTASPESYSTNLSVRGVASIGVVGGPSIAPDDAYRFLDVVDDVVKLVMEIEQGTEWTELQATMGERTRVISNTDLSVSYPEEESEAGHLAIVRWTYSGEIAWGS